MLQISGIAALERTCKEFLYADNDQAAREEILLRAATGWWRLDYDTLRLLEPWETLMNQLVTIYPVSFASACFSSALQVSEPPAGSADERGKGLRHGPLRSIYSLRQRD